jgi:Na+-transporting NADH:ubiquinone oxidoreductase subunit C
VSNPKDSVKQTLIVAAALCLVCSVLVSGAAVMLKPTQDYNRALDRKRNILQAAGLMQSEGDIDTLFKQIEPRVVDLEKGSFVETVDAASYDQRKASRDPKLSTTLTVEQDIAGIKRRADQANVYLVRDAAGGIQNIILPVHGYGLWSTMYGFLALDGDARTVVGFKFYQQGETPGLGGEIANPQWQALWVGKQVLDADGRPAVQLVKGGVDPGSAEAVHQVDALSGATLTSNGVANLLQFWLGEDGFGPFLASMREQQGSSKNG